MRRAAGQQHVDAWLNWAHVAADGIWKVGARVVAAFGRRTVSFAYAVLPRPDGP